MYCDKCGTPFVSGSQYCTSCGKQIVSGPVSPGTQGASATLPAAQTAASGPQASSDGRVRRNITLVAGLWAANGVLRLMELGWFTLFHNWFYEWGWNGPFGRGFGFSPFLWGGIMSAGVFLALFGVVHLALAWGLLERQPWARVLGIVIACLALIRFPFGTALGIYTLWVLLPESSAKEYDAMAGTQPSIAR